MKADDFINSFHKSKFIDEKGQIRHTIADASIYDINMRDGETEETTAFFEKNLKKRIENWKKANPTKHSDSAPW
jgi:hypothetical protein